MKPESDLLVLFGSEALGRVPRAWRELHEKFPTPTALGDFLTTFTDEPYWYRPERWYSYVPKLDRFIPRTIDPESLQEWIWFFAGDDGFSDAQVSAVLKKVREWATKQRVTHMTLTVPPLAAPRGRAIHDARRIERRMERLKTFMRVTERTTGILVGTLIAGDINE